MMSMCACGGVNCPHCNPNLWRPGEQHIHYHGATKRCPEDVKRIAELEAELLKYKKYAMLYEEQTANCTLYREELQQLREALNNIHSSYENDGDWIGGEWVTNKTFEGHIDNIPALAERVEGE